MSFVFKPKVGAFSTETHDQFMICRLIKEERELERASMARRSDLTVKILSYHRGGMSRKKLSDIYGLEMVNTVFAEMDAEAGVCLAILPDSFDTREPLSACGARVTRKMTRNRIGARA